MSTHRTIQEIRHENLLTAIERAGSQTALANASGLSIAYLSQLKTRSVDSKTQRPREVGDDAARAIERALGETPGWMDQDHRRAEQIERALTFVEWLDSLTPEERAKLPTALGLVTDKAIPDAVIEAKMPVTRKMREANESRRAKTKDPADTDAPAAAAGKRRRPPRDER